MKKKIYIFSARSRAAVYGIGTYISQLTSCLKNAGIDFAVIYLYAEEREVTQTEKNGYPQISIPAVNMDNGEKSAERYNRNLVYLLKDFIREKEETERIFHLNFMSDNNLVDCLRNNFNCKILLTVHYTEWSFALLGDLDRLKQILRKRKSRLKPYEKHLKKKVEDDIRFINQCDHTVFISQHTFDSYKEMGAIEETKTSLVNNSLKDVYHSLSSIRKSELRQKAHIKDETKIIFFAGRLDAVKGVNYLIKAFKAVLQKHSEAHLFIAGDGDFSGLTKEASGIWPKVTFTGRLSKKELFRFYSLADIGVVSSIHEEFGYVAIEMMMHHLPMVVTDTTGLSEIIQDGKNGLKIPIKKVGKLRQPDVQKLSEKIVYLLDTPQKASRLGQNARKTFLTKYENTLFSQKMLNIYRDL